MEELGNVLTELIRAGRDVAPMALGGYFAYRILEVIAWPCMYFGIGYSVIRVIGMQFMEGWELRQRARLHTANAKLAEQLIKAEEMVERRQKESASYEPPKWHATAHAWMGGEFTT